MTTDTIAPLYPFQERAIQQMAKLPHVFLFDEMGLGKTRQALEVVQLQDLKPCLIICPKTLVWNWYDEIIKWFPDEVPCIFRDTDQFVDSYVADKRRFFIMWHDVLARILKDEILEIVPRFAWQAVIVDEVHHLRNWNTQRGEGLLRFQKGKKFLLSGTPIVNSSMDLYPLIKLADLDISPQDFRESYTYTTIGPYGPKTYGFRNRKQFMELLGPLWIQRKKIDVLKDLPPKTVQRLTLEMDPDQRRVYNNLITMLFIELDSGEKIETSEILALLTRLRQVTLDPRILAKSASSAKTKAIKELFTNYNGKVVIYSNFKQYINLLQPELEAIGIKTVRLTGDEDGRARLDAVNKFQQDPRIRAFLSTMQSGGLGITLTAASMVVVTDQWWNKVRTDQAIDRLHRIGQTNKVTAILLHCRDSIDDHIDKIVQGKDASAMEVIEAIRERGY